MSDGICESTLTPNDVTYRCTKVAGHEGMHSGYVFEWHEERPKPSPAPEGAEMETLRELARGAARELHRIAPATPSTDSMRWRGCGKRTPR